MHHHHACLEPLDPGGLCEPEQPLETHRWGLTPNQQTPTFDQWSIRLRSHSWVVDQSSWLTANAPVRPIVLTAPGGKALTYCGHNAMVPGGTTYDLATAVDAVGQVVECAIAQGPAEGPFLFGVGTHLWNMADDADGNGIPDGIEDLQALQTAIATPGAFSRDPRILYQTIDTIEAQR